MIDYAEVEPEPAVRSTLFCSLSLCLKRDSLTIRLWRSKQLGEG